jgi:ribosomal protein L11 methyltransferase
VTVADRLTVAFAWSEHDRSHRPNVVEIDPEGGFGSGQHPATRLILEALATRVAGGERVLDVGCGNGILGLAALRLGGTHLVAIDIAPDAVTATRRNAELNGLTDLVDARSVPLDQIGQGPFDVVLANIGRAALVDLGPALAARVAPDGWLGVSGFSPPQCDVVAAALHPLSLIDTQVTGEWAALTLGRRGAPSP